MFVCLIIELTFIQFIHFIYLSSTFIQCVAEVTFIIVMRIGPPVTWLQAEAQQLEMATLRKFGAGIGAPTRQEQVNDAADIHIKLGNVQRYCELMIELGQVLCPLRSFHLAMHSEVKLCEMSNS